MASSELITSVNSSANMLMSVSQVGSEHNTNQAGFVLKSINQSMPDTMPRTKESPLPQKNQHPSSFVPNVANRTGQDSKNKFDPPNYSQHKLSSHPVTDPLFPPHCCKP
ncbi:hypothetical protein ABZP36_016536 [Zizania latifolia]